MNPRDRIILSLDGFKSFEGALVSLEGLSVPGAIVKVKALADGAGIFVAQTLANKGYRPFVDFKVYDTPDAAAERVAVWRDAGAEFFTIHASGHGEMMKKCIDAAGEKMKIIAVTVLTSFDAAASTDVFGFSPRTAVLALARIARRAGIHGIVASPEEVAMLRKSAGWEDGATTAIFTPGIRPAWAQKNDQKRTATPAEAIRAGADYLIIGRPIFNPPPEIGSPTEAFGRIVSEVESASLSCCG